jgi:hypothetical protein
MDCARSQFAISVFVAALLLAGPAICPAPAAVLEGFETPEVSWRAGEADVAYRVEAHQRITTDAHSGHGSELLQISANGGTHVYFTHDFGTARIVAELTPSVWVKANRPGIQFLARVVLPHTADPRTGQPVVTLIRGDSYATVGSWQQLRIADTPQLVTRQVRVLRAQMGPQVDPREAFIDQVLLNVYGGPGQTAVNIDDLDIAGIVPHDAAIAPGAPVRPVSANSPALPSNQMGANSNGGVMPAAAFGAPGANGSGLHQVSLSGSVLLVDGKPFYPRMIESQGEPLPWLKQQGFNAVRCDGQISSEMLAEAQRLNLWLVGPPPARNWQNQDGSTSLTEITAAYDPILAWNLGAGLATRELLPTVAVSKQLRQLDRQLRRPLVCSAEEDLLAFSRQVDVLSSYRLPLQSTLQLKDYGDWIRNRPRLVRLGTPLWTVVQTEAAPAVTEQAAALSGKQAPEPLVDADSFRLLAYQAFCCGARGIEFASSSRLDASDYASQLRATSLALLNLELELIEPWGAAGNFVTSATSNDPSITGIVLQTDTARLVVAMRCPKDSQYVAAPQANGTALPPIAGTAPPKANTKPAPITDTPTHKSDGSADLRSGKALSRPGGGTRADSLGARQADDYTTAGTTPQPSNLPAPGTATLVVPGVPDGHDVYELTPAGLRRLRHERITGGTAIALEDFALTAVVLITQDPSVERAMTNRTAASAPLAAQLERKLSQLLLAQTEAVDRRLVGQTQLPPAAMTLAASRTDLARADQLLAAGDYSHAYYAARNAALPLGRWKRETWERTVKPLASPVSSPLAVSFNTLPDHLAFMYSTIKVKPGENLLPGGDFENLQTILQSGWQHFEHAQPEVQTSVELSPIAPYAGRMSLKMQVRANDPKTAPTIVETPPLWITSAPVHMNAGDVVCIRGQVRVPSAVSGSVDGLMIFDSLGGEALAERVDQTSGWHEFVLYRAAPHAEDLTLTFALTGLGEAWVDDISVRLVRSGVTAGLPSSAPFVQGATAGVLNSGATAGLPSSAFSPPALQTLSPFNPSTAADSRLGQVRAAPPENAAQLGGARSSLQPANSIATQPLFAPPQLH